MLVKANVFMKLSGIFLPFFEKDIDKIWLWLYHTYEVSGC